jgi:protein-disulfide isomerase
MTDGPQPPTPQGAAPVPPSASQPSPTTVVGYPEATPPTQPAGYASPGVASLRSQVRTVRYLVIASLAILVLLTLGLILSIASSRAQIEDLSAQITALGEQAAAQSAAQQAPAPAATGQPQAAAVEQLGAAPALAADVTMPSGVDATGAVLIGDPNASNVVEVYIDYQCPFCQRWEETIGTSLAAAALQPGSDLLLKQYNLAFLGETSPSLQPAGASARAASAAACVLDNDGTETFVSFSRRVFETADPNEPPGQFTAPVLTDLATSVGASAPTLACIEAEQHVPFVAATTQGGFGRGVGGTPTVIVNGQTLGNPFTDAAITDLVSAS